MSELWGMAAGFNAADANARQNVLGAVQAQKALGDIAMQPAQQRLIEAHAGVEEAQLRDAKMLQDLAANSTASDAAAAKGEILPMADAPSRQASLADPLRRMYDLGMQKGASPSVLIPLATKIAGIEQKEAASAASTAQQQKAQTETRIKQMERVGSLAQYALQGPQQYKEALAEAASDPTLKDFPLSRLPLDWKAAQPILGGLQAQSIKAIDAQKLALRAASDESKDRLRSAQEGKIGFSIDYLKAKTDIAKDTLARTIKNGGEGSPSVVARRDELNANSKTKRDTLDRKEFPQLPADPKAVTVPGSRFTWPDGVTRVEYIGKDPATGKQMFKPLARGAKSPTSTSRPATSSPSTSSAPTADTKDDSNKSEDD